MTICVILFDKLQAKPTCASVQVNNVKSLPQEGETVKPGQVPAGQNRHGVSLVYIVVPYRASRQGDQRQYAGGRLFLFKFEGGGARWQKRI